MVISNCAPSFSSFPKFLCPGSFNFLCYASIPHEICLLPLLHISLQNSSFTPSTGFLSELSFPHLLVFQSSLQSPDPRPYPPSPTCSQSLFAYPNPGSFPQLLVSVAAIQLLVSILSPHLSTGFALVLCFKSGNLIHIVLARMRVRGPWSTPYLLFSCLNLDLVRQQKDLSCYWRQRALLSSWLEPVQGGLKSWTI